MHLGKADGVKDFHLFAIKSTLQALNMKSESNLCPRCDQSIQADAPAGLCPHCLLDSDVPVDVNITNSLPSRRGFKAPEPSELNGRIEGIEVMELLGRGGMGAVYRAKQINLDRPVALKIMSPELSVQPAFDERFRREARTLAKLSHPNIVTIYDFGQAGEYCYLIMELVDGVNLREAIVSSAITPKQALTIIPNICDALQYAHNKGVVHRDIKPENVLIGMHGGVKIADFGLAKLLNHETADFTLTATQQILGSRNYMAPEQIEKPTTVDHRADIYSLGVVFYELLTGELPLGRFSLPSEKAKVDGQLDEVVLRTLEKEPERRYQQASQIRTALESLDYEAESPLEPVNGQPSIPKNGTPEHQFTPPQSPLILPFRKNLFGGCQKLQGLATLHETCLKIQFQVQTFGFRTSSPNQRIEIPYQQLKTCFIGRQFLLSTLEIHGDSMESLGTIPGNEGGCLTIVIEKKNQTTLTEFHRQLTNKIQQADHRVDRETENIGAPIPFNIPNILHGWGEAPGLASLNQTSMIVEFERQDVTGFFKTAGKRVVISLSDIAEVKLIQGIWGSAIEVQTSNMNKASAVPGSEQGRFKLRVKNQYRPQAAEFVKQACRLTSARLQDDLQDRKPSKGDVNENSITRRIALAKKLLVGGKIINSLQIFAVLVVLILANQNRFGQPLLVNDDFLFLFGLFAPGLSTIACICLSNLIKRFPTRTRYLVVPAILLLLPLSAAVILTLPATVLVIAAHISYTKRFRPN